jgi:hypothetical protein
MTLQEDAVPINNASSGNVAGLGNDPSDPPVSKKLKQLIHTVRRTWSTTKKPKNSSSD